MTVCAPSASERYLICARTFDRMGARFHTTTINEPANLSGVLWRRVEEWR